MKKLIIIIFILLMNFRLLTFASNANPNVSYSVQVAAFEVEELAMSLVERLNTQKFEVITIYGELILIRVGRVSTLEEAISLLSDLKERGHGGIIVREFYFVDSMFITNKAENTRNDKVVHVIEPEINYNDDKIIDYGSLNKENIPIEDNYSSTPEIRRLVDSEEFRGAAIFSLGTVSVFLVISLLVLIKRRR